MPGGATIPTIMNLGTMRCWALCRDFSALHQHLPHETPAQGNRPVQYFGHVQTAHCRGHAVGNRLYLPDHCGGRLTAWDSSVQADAFAAVQDPILLRLLWLYGKLEVRRDHGGPLCGHLFGGTAAESPARPPVQAGGAAQRGQRGREGAQDQGPTGHPGGGHLGRRVLHCHHHRVSLRSPDALFPGGDSGDHRHLLPLHRRLHCLPEGHEEAGRTITTRPSTSSEFPACSTG